MTTVDAYLVHWNAPHWCIQSVESLLSSTVDVKVTVINNGGVLDLPPSVRVVNVGRNIGFSGGANVGLALARQSVTDFVFIGCHDIQLSSDALGAMAEVLQADPGLGIVGPLLNSKGGSETDLEWISGSAMLMRRKISRDFRFDERFGSYVEDVDFCWRVRQAGWRIGRCASAHARMKGSVDPARALMLMHSNTLVYFVRAREWRNVIKRVLLVGSECLRNLRAHSWRTSLMYARSLIAGAAKVVLFPFQRSDRLSRGCCLPIYDLATAEPFLGARRLDPRTSRSQPRR